MSMTANNPSADRGQVSMFYEELYHDLKTPISIMFAYIQLLERMNSLPTQALHYLTETKKNCYRVAKLVRDANDGARLSRGMMLPRFVNDDIVSLVRDICEDARVLTDAKNIRILCTSAKPSIKAALDRLIIERILLNLLANARQHSYDGGVIRVTLWDEDGHIFVSIRDYGKGVPEAMTERLFERGEGETGRGTHSGLGLYIVRELAQLLGGSVYLSPVSPGTEAVLMLPMFLTDETAEEPDVDDFFINNAVQMELSF